MAAINEVAANRYPSAQRMNFSKTCNLLSQYVKEKRSLSISGGRYNRATMKLFPVNGKPAEDSFGSTVENTISIFPQISGFDSSMNKRESPEQPASQMTIFYGGQVVVFSDLSADKAKEVMDLASSFESSLKKRKVETPVGLATGPVSVPVPVPVPLPVPASVPVSNAKPNAKPNPIQNQNAPRLGSNVISSAAVAVPRSSLIVSDIPMARKASLHRFLDKRKERLVGKAPASENGSTEGAKKPVEGKAWLGLNSLPNSQQQQQKQL